MAKVLHVLHFFLCFEYSLISDTTGTAMYTGLETFAENLVTQSVTKTFPRTSLLDVLINIDLIMLLNI